ncbi:MAG: MFS transporter [bacterium]|nr:MFS transporter [bacterium]
MNNRSVLPVVFFTVFLDLLGFGILIPLLPYVAVDYGASPFMVGLLMTSYSLAQFLFAPLWGAISDRAGRRPIILLSLAGSTAGYLIFAYSHTLTGLFISRILSGVAAANISTANAIIADVMPPEKRTKGMGMVGAAIGLGFVFGPAMAGVFVGEHNYTLPFLIAAGLSGLDFCMAAFMLPETKRADVESPVRKRYSWGLISSALGMRCVPTLLLTSLLYYIAFSAMESTFALFVLDQFGWNARTNGLVLFGVGLVMTFIQGGMVGRVSKRLGDFNVLTMGVFGVFAGLMLISESQTPTMFLTSVFIMSVSAGFASPALVSLISQFSAQEVQGGMLGLNQSMASMGRILGPLLGTALFGAAGAHSPFAAGATLVGISAALVLAVRKSQASANA